MRRSPKDTQESARMITRRGLMLGGAQAAMVAVLGTRMHTMQVEPFMLHRHDAVFIIHRRYF